MHWGWHFRKFNPYHDADGKFTDAASSAMSSAEADKDGVDDDVFDIGDEDASISDVSEHDPEGLADTVKMIKGAHASVKRARAEQDDQTLAAMGEATSLYLSGDFNDVISDYLRNNGKLSERYAGLKPGSSNYATMNDMMSDIVKHMDLAFKYGYKLKEDITVWRGMPLDRRNEWVEKIKPGALVTDKAFISTSQQRELAAHFSGGVESGVFMDKPYGTPHMFKIVVPKGTTVLPDASHGVSEVVLPRNSVFAITSVQVIGAGTGKGGYAVTMRML